MDVIDDPNMAGVEESMQKDSDLTPSDLQARINLKREQRYADEGVTVPPGLGDDVEPLPEAEVAEPPEVEQPDEEEEPEELEEEPQSEEPDEEELPEPEEPEEEVEEEDFYLGRYRTKEAAEAGLAEKDRMIDSFLRWRAEEPEREVADEGPQQLDVPAWNHWAEESVAAGRGQAAAMEALQNGGPEAYDIYFGHWANDPEQAPQAHAFNNWVTRYFADQRAQMATAPLLQQNAEQSARSEAQEAQQIVAAQYEDFADHLETMNRLVSEEGGLPPETRERLQQMSQVGLPGKIHAWEFLYQAARATNGERRRKVDRAEEGRRRAKADKAKIAATVSSSEGAQTRTPRSAAEDYVIQKKNAIRQRLGQPLIEE